MLLVLLLTINFQKPNKTGNKKMLEIIKKLEWSEQKIAKNLNYYKMAKPTEEFWTAWKTNKEELKSTGISVFKGEDGQFNVFDWSCKDKATQAEYDEQQRIAELKKSIYESIDTTEYYRQACISAIQSDDHIRTKVAKELISCIRASSNTDDMYDYLLEEANDIETMWGYITQEAKSDIDNEYQRLLNVAGIA
jgi:hypothetical protein